MSESSSSLNDLFVMKFYLEIGCQSTLPKDAFHKIDQNCFYRIISEGEGESFYRKALLRFNFHVIYAIYTGYNFTI